MLNKILNKFSGKDVGISREEIVEILKTNPELLEQFENSYSSILEEKSDNFFEVNSKQAVKDSKANLLEENPVEVEKLVSKIVEELLGNYEALPVHSNEINYLPEKLRPELSGKLYKKDIKASSYPMVLNYYKRFKQTGNVLFYHQFRQGLDILDLDPILYEIIGQNKNSMGYWFPKITAAIDNQGFFKYPKTKIVKVPLPILQLTRLDYMSLSPTTKRIVNEFCMKAFDLDVNKKYFIKTGTYSSKFDFRNALVQGEQEVQEIGEYLLYIHFQALQMASPLNNRTIYGVSTTNEWVVREFVDDIEMNPTIYKGMPLRTEFRFFVDMDKKSILGVSPYWREDVMVRSFNENPQDPHKKHDYVIYKTNEAKLNKDYEENVEMLSDKILKLIENVDGLKGQWSVDIMKNGNDFYLIDMASAAESALSDCVPKGLLEKNEENWIPTLERGDV